LKSIGKLLYYYSFFIVFYRFIVNQVKLYKVIIYIVYKVIMYIIYYYCQII